MALTKWGLPSTGYKDPKGSPVRLEIVSGLNSKVDLRQIRDLCLSDDNILDATICSLVGWLAKTDGTSSPSPGIQHERALAEGWIHFPR